MSNYGEMLKIAIEEAKAGLAERGIPVGAALFDSEGNLLGRGRNRRVQDNDPSIHGETDAFRKAGRQKSYQDTIMVTTLSPCWYCSGLIRQFGIGTVVIGESVNFKGGEDWLRENGVKVIPMNDAECIEMMADFIRKNPKVWNEDVGLDPSHASGLSRHRTRFDRLLILSVVLLGIAPILAEFIPRFRTDSFSLGETLFEFVLGAGLKFVFNPFNLIALLLWKIRRSRTVPEMIVVAAAGVLGVLALLVPSYVVMWEGVKSGFAGGRTGTALTSGMFFFGSFLTGAIGHFLGDMAVVLFRRERKEPRG